MNKNVKFVLTQKWFRMPVVGGVDESHQQTPPLRLVRTRFLVRINSKTLVLNTLEYCEFNEYSSKSVRCYKRGSKFKVEKELRCFDISFTILVRWNLSSKTYKKTLWDDHSELLYRYHKHQFAYFTFRVFYKCNNV